MSRTSLCPSAGVWCCSAVAVVDSERAEALLDSHPAVPEAPGWCSEVCGSERERRSDRWSESWSCSPATHTHTEVSESFVCFNNNVWMKSVPLSVWWGWTLALVLVSSAPGADALSCPPASHCPSLTDQHHCYYSNHHYPSSSSWTSAILLSCTFQNTMNT